MKASYIDISPRISPRTAVFPGDQPFERTIALDFKAGDHLRLSRITTTVHVGAHADAPNHYHPDGVGILAPRVLFKTGSFPDPDRWNGDFNSLSPELIDWLASRDVLLVGIDTPSVDPADSQGLESHHRIFEHDLAILEGIVLDAADEGLYELIALPLRIEGADASPVRAILLPHGVPIS